MRTTVQVTRTKCSVRKCKLPLHAKGLCITHYQAKRREKIRSKS